MDLIQVEPQRRMRYPPDGGCSYFNASLSFPGGLVKMQVLVFLVLEWSVCTFNEPQKMLTVLVLELTHGVTVQQGLSGVLSFSVVISTYLK